MVRTYAYSLTNHGTAGLHIWICQAFVISDWNEYISLCGSMPSRMWFANYCYNPNQTGQPHGLSFKLIVPKSNAQMQELVSCLTRHLTLYYGILKFILPPDLQFRVIYSSCLTSANTKYVSPFLRGLNNKIQAHSSLPLTLPDVTCCEYRILLSSEL